MNYAGNDLNKILTILITLFFLKLNDNEGLLESYPSVSLSG